MISVAKPKPMTCWFCEKPSSATERSQDGRACCAQCKAFMMQGVICIGVSVELEPDTLIDKIYRDGNWCVLSSAEYTKRFNKNPPGYRFAFVMSDAWKKAYLPRFGKHGASHTDATNVDPELVALMDEPLGEEEQA